MGKGALGCEIYINPRGHAEGDAFGLVLHHLGLGDVRCGKVDTEVAQRAVLGGHDAHGKHASVEDEVGTLTINGEVLELLDGDAHGTVGMLVVVADIILLMHGTVGVEVILARGKIDGGRLACSISLDMIKELRHGGRHIGSRTGNYAKLGGVIHFARRGGKRYRNGSKNEGYTFHRVHSIQYI